MPAYDRGFINGRPRLGNAAGTCKSIDGERGVAALASSPYVTNATTGSYTPMGRAANGPINEHFDNSRGLNTKGLPNIGIEPFCKDILPKMLAIAEAAGKVLTVSVSGETPEDNAMMMYQVCNVYLEHERKVREAGGTPIVHRVEINFACPNKWGPKGQARMACFQPEACAEVFDYGKELVGTDPFVLAKVAPFSDPFGIVDLADALRPFPLFKGVTTCNTFANGWDVDDSFEPVITFGKGYAGVSGPPLRVIALGQVHQWRDQLPDHWIIGVGGVPSGRDVLNLYVAGADEVQIGTAFYTDPNIFERIGQEIAVLTS